MENQGNRLQQSSVREDGRRILRVVREPRRQSRDFGAGAALLSKNSCRCWLVSGAVAWWQGQGNSGHGENNERNHQPGLKAWTDGIDHFERAELAGVKQKGPCHPTNLMQRGCGQHKMGQDVPRAVRVGQRRKQHLRAQEQCGNHDHATRAQQCFLALLMVRYAPARLATMLRGYVSIAAITPRSSANPRIRPING